jgi:hypothetical protein
MDALVRPLAGAHAALLSAAVAHARRRSLVDDKLRTERAHETLLRLAEPVPHMDDDRLANIDDGADEPKGTASASLCKRSSISLAVAVVTPAAVQSSLFVGQRPLAVTRRRTWSRDVSFRSGSAGSRSAFMAALVTLAVPWTANPIA